MKHCRPSSEHKRHNLKIRVYIKKRIRITERIAPQTYESALHTHVDVITAHYHVFKMSYT